MKNIVLSQREERDKLLSLEYQKRLVYNLVIMYRDSKPIKLITGPRRSGKSVLALQMLKGKNFAYLNFDDTALLNRFSEDAVELALSEVYPNYEYLLLDEIQNLDGWSLWVEKLYRRGVNIIITGSNANMLSDDIAAVLSGRFIEIRLFPFSATEYLQFMGLWKETNSIHNTNDTYRELDKFSLYGGFPEVIKTPQITANYLSSLYDTILTKDIVRRFKIRKVEELYLISDWLLSNFTNTFSYNSLATELNMGSVPSVQKYCRYLSNTFMFQYLPRFNNKLKIMNKADKKVYVIDNGFVMARAFGLSKNLGKLLENLVFLELIKIGYDLKKYELFYYRSKNNKEVDFVCRRGVFIEQLIQVCYNIESPKTMKREVNALIECAKELNNKNLTIITWNREEIVEQSGYTIHIQSLYKWISSLSPIFKE